MIAPREEPVSAGRALSLRANFSWTFVGNIVYAASQWGILTVLAKLGSPEMVGQFALGLAIAAPVFMFTNLQLRGVLATDARGEYRFGDYLALRLVATVLALFTVGVLVVSGGHPQQTSLVIVLVGVAKGAEAISDVIYGLFQHHEHMEHIAMSLMIKGPLSLVVVGVAVWLTGSVVWGALGMAVVWAAVLAGYDIRTGRRLLRHTQAAAGDASADLHPGRDPRVLARLAAVALPLGIVMLMISLKSNLPRYFIEAYGGVRELGIFAALAYLLVAGDTVVSALGQAAEPRLARYYARGSARAFCGLLLKLSSIVALLGVMGVAISLLAGREVLALLYRPEYAEHLPVFVWLAAGAGLGYVASVLGYSITAARYFAIQVPLFALVTASAWLACEALIPAGGLLGAAMALNIATLVQIGGSLLITGFAVHKLMRRAC